jgi:hypothetical protein
MFRTTDAIMFREPKNADLKGCEIAELIVFLI